MLRFYDFYIDQQELLIRRAKYRGIKFILIYILVLYGFCTAVVFSPRLDELPFSPDQLIDMEGFVRSVPHIGRPGVCGHSMVFESLDGSEVRLDFRYYGQVFRDIKDKKVIVRVEKRAPRKFCPKNSGYFVFEVEYEEEYLIEYTWERYMERVSFQDTSIFILIYSSFLVLFLMSYIYMNDRFSKD